PPHSQAAVAQSAAQTTIHPAAGSRKTAPSKPARSRIAVTTRSLSIGALPCDRSRLELLARAPEATLPPLIRPDRVAERGGIEVGPQHVGEEQLGVGQLPEQEVADPLFAARTDEQIGLWGEMHREFAREFVFAEAVAAFGMARHQARHRVHD